MENDLELKCYIADKRNKTLYNGYKEWEEDYLPWLTKTDPNSPYNDPDSLDREDYNYEYYRDIAVFLNEREKEFFSEKSRYWYKACEKDKDTYGIGVYTKAECKSGKEIFYLKSDQFGFSAPFENLTKKHPYEYCIEKSRDKSVDDASVLKKVSKWIYYSRTIGGAFLWPLENNNGEWNKEPTINHVRGRKDTQEDRVDLTLAWIREFYLGSNTSKLLKGHLKEWLEHFIDPVESSSNICKSGFSNYVKFFMFDDFVDEVLLPKDITSKELKSLYEHRYTTGKERLGQFDEEKICVVLENVCSLICSRSNRMMEKIKKMKSVSIDAFK